MEVTKLMMAMIGIVVFIFLTFGYMNSIGETYNMTASEDYTSLYNASTVVLGDLEEDINQTNTAFDDSNAVVQAISFVTSNAILAGKTLIGGIGIVTYFFTTLAGLFGLPSYFIGAIVLIISLIGMIALFRLLSGGVRP